MERDAQERGLDDDAGGEGCVEVGGIEADHPVPEGEIRRRRLLRLQGHDPADGLDNVESLPAQQELPAEGGPVELSRGESHGGSWQPTTGPGLGGPGGDPARRPDPQLTAFFTSAAIRASASGVSSTRAKAVGHIAPSSRLASGWKPNVAYLTLNFEAAWKKQTILPPRLA